jgi:fermentation-respiration switch protein FrsA (DUF1100 family)
MYKVALVIIVFLIAADIAGSFYFYRMAIARSKKQFLSNNKDLQAATPVPKLDDPRAWLEKQQLKNIELQSWDGLKLQGYYLEAEKPSKKTAILAHGYSSKGKDMAAFARFYRDTLGYNVLMPDDRGHGQSEGDYIGFGWMDRKDYVKWINYVINTLNKDSEIILHGISMGGATVLMTSGEELPSNVKAIVSDCAYTSALDQLSYQLSRMYRLPSFPVLQSTSLLTKIKAGYFFGEASAVKQVSKTKLPILFIHGDEDKFVPYEMVNTLYEACNSEKDIFIVPKAGHGTAYNFDKAGYERKVTGFLEKYVSK